MHLQTARIRRRRSRNIFFPSFYDTYSLESSHQLCPCLTAILLSFFRRCHVFDTLTERFFLFQWPTSPCVSCLYMSISHAFCRSSWCLIRLLLGIPDDCLASCLSQSLCWELYVKRSSENLINE